ncbi:hypothetical protein V9T40_007294 [Parthenolecanium corni]|uniref:Major facilitator superfamily domain-containing protein 12-like n=1 Tax=Parthenolecanium corni TaxID=536013 RepID=A0AAN9YAM7_9HEMI
MPESVTLSYPVWLAYGVGHVLNDLCSSIWFTYTLLFFEIVLEFDSSLAGAAIVIGQIVDGLSTPIVGILSDKRFDHWIFKYGRRKIWHLLGTILVSISFPFIFSPYYGFPHLNPVQQLLYYSAFIICFQMGWAATQVSHLSLVPDLTSDQHSRTSLYTIRYSFTVLSNIIVYIIFLAVLHFNNAKSDNILGPKDERKFQLLAFIVVVIGAIMSTIFHIGVKEKHDQSNDGDRLIASTPDRLSRLSLFRNPKMYAVGCIYVATRLFVNLSQVYIPYYIHTYLRLMSKKLAILPLVMYISSFITSTVVHQLNVHFGRKVTYLVGALIGLLSCLWVHVGRNEDIFFKTYEVYGVVIFFGCACAIILVTSLGISADLIGQDTDNGAFVYGILSFGDKISNGLAVFLIQNLKANHYNNYYKNALTIGCAVSLILGSAAILLLKLPEPTDVSSDVITDSENKIDESEVNTTVNRQQ